MGIWIGIVTAYASLVFVAGLFALHRFRRTRRSASDATARNARFGSWLPAVVGPVWLVNVAAYQSFRDRQGSAILASIGIAYFIISLALLGLIAHRYQRGDERPFPTPRNGVRIDRTGRRVLFGLTVAGFLIFVIWANRPL